MCNISHLTFIFKLDVGTVKVNMHAKHTDAESRNSRVSMFTDTQTDRHVVRKPLPLSLS